MLDGREGCGCDFERGGGIMDWGGAIGGKCGLCRLGKLLE